MLFIFKRYKYNDNKTSTFKNLSLARFSIKMKFLYHETIFLICGNKKTKNRKINHIIKYVMILIFFMLRKLRYIKYQIV